MARRSQCSNAGDNPLDPNYLQPHYREEYRLAVDALVEQDLEGYYNFLQKADVVDFLSSSELEYIQSSVQLPAQNVAAEQQRLFDTGDGDGSSDTYWPVHSDLDAPDLDLGWPQVHHYIGPTEVTTLVNPPEPDMPSIKEQARRLIKNAQQVIAIVMDVFSDVDMFADVLSAAMRNVAVYILLDSENVHHFNNMVANCRVNLQSIQSLRVRTVSGITYNCRSGKTLKGQMMDRFLLTDCRAVLSGNYSFMWSFEKLHRCMAHLFLGQLVSTFDEEFRILFALSQPLMMENVLAPVDEFSLPQKRQFPSDKTLMYRDLRRFQSLDTPEERSDLDWRAKPLKRVESFHNPADLYSRFPAHLDNPASKRHSYAEGIPGRYSNTFLQQQQGFPDPENQGRQFHRGQQQQQLQPYPGPRREEEYGQSYDKFWNQDFHSADQYSESGLPQDVDSSGDFDPVLNYLSSTRSVDFDQGSESSAPVAADVPFSSSQPRRLTAGQPYACQRSPSPNPTEQKQFYLEPSADRKDPVVKRGLRDWRISSFLNTYDNPGEEGLPMAPSNAPEAFEDPPGRTPLDVDPPYTKIPNVREFKIPALPRASQMPSFAKTPALLKRSPDEPNVMATETKTTPSPSESSSTTEAEKSDEVELREPRPVGFQREDSFRRKYNVSAPRSSRLRSSLIFSSLDQQNTPEDEEGDKNEAEQKRPPFISQVFGQRRSTQREPIEWSKFVKSATLDESATNKEADSKGATGDPSAPESSKPLEEDQPSSLPSLSESIASDLLQINQTAQKQQPVPLLPAPMFVDMSDADNRLLFFKELAAKRRAAKDAEEEKNKMKAQTKPTQSNESTAVKKEGNVPDLASEKMAETPKTEGLLEKLAIAEDKGKSVSTDECASLTLSLDASDETNKEKTEPKKLISTLVEEPKLSTPSVEKYSHSDPPAPTDTLAASVPGGVDENKRTCLESGTEDCSSFTPSSAEAPDSSYATIDSNTQRSESSRLETRIPSSSSSSSPPLPQSEQHAGTEGSPLKPSDRSSSSRTHSTSSQSSSAPVPDVIPEVLGSNTLENVSLSVQEPAQLHEETSQTSMESSIGQTESKSTHQLDPVSTLTLSDTRPAVDCAHVELDMASDTCAPHSEPNTSSLHSSTPTDSAESCALTTLRICEESDVLGSPEGFKTDTTPPKESILPDVSDDLQDAPSEVTPPSKLDPTGPLTLALSEKTSCLAPQTESVGSVLSPEAEKTTLPALQSPSEAADCLPKQVTTDTNETPTHTLTGAGSPTEPTSNLPTELGEPESVISESHRAEDPPVLGEKTNTGVENEESEKSKSDDTEAATEVDETTRRDSVCSEKTNDLARQSSEEDGAVPLSPQTKTPKTNQNRYSSSTANVISSSNLRDDTKLLLEQISASSQSRNEATKEAPVTDDEKEDEADKNALREKERGIRTFSRGKPKSNEEREKALERIQSMRKERKVYSRFEMAP